jgi:hypothetical protein
MSDSPHFAYRSSLGVARKLGADATIAKPFEAAELIAVVRSALANGGSGQTSRTSERLPHPASWKGRFQGRSDGTMTVENVTTAERRVYSRASAANELTGLVEAIRHDPVKAALDLKREMNGDAALVRTRELLEVVEQVAHFRGLELHPQVVIVWKGIAEG